MFAVGLASLAGAGSANAAAITVNTTSDTYGLHDTHCSLRDAVQAVETQAKFGACPAPGGTAKIVLRAGTYKLTMVLVSSPLSWDHG